MPVESNSEKDAFRLPVAVNIVSAFVAVGAIGVVVVVAAAVVAVCVIVVASGSGMQSELLGVPTCSGLSVAAAAVSSLHPPFGAAASAET